jgi:hypothetical protein
MPTITFPARGTNFAFLVSESNGYQSREESVVRSGAGVLPGGTVMGRLGTGKWEAWVTGGTYTAGGVLASDVDATLADVKRTIFVRGCEVQRSQLTFSGTPTSPQKDTAYALLAASNILMR